MIRHLFQNETTKITFHLMVIDNKWYKLPRYFIFRVAKAVLCFDPAMSAGTEKTE